jgi:hypothetical protein
VDRQDPNLGDCGVDGCLDDGALLLSTVDIAPEDVACENSGVNICSGKRCDVIIRRLADSMTTVMCQRTERRRN